jgi:hypothetical protein
MAEGIRKRIIEIRKDGLCNGPREKNVGLWWKSNGNESRVGGEKTVVGASSKKRNTDNVTNSARH